MEIAKEDKAHDIERIEGYVDADFTTVRRLKDFFQRALVAQYEEQFYKKMMVHQIIMIIMLIVVVILIVLLVHGGHIPMISTWL